MTKLIVFCGALLLLIACSGSNQKGSMYNPYGGDDLIIYGKFINLPSGKAKVTLQYTKENFLFSDAEYRETEYIDIKDEYLEGKDVYFIEELSGNNPWPKQIEFVYNKYKGYAVEALVTRFRTGKFKNEKRTFLYVGTIDVAELMKDTVYTTPTLYEAVNEKEITDSVFTKYFPDMKMKYAGFRPIKIFLDTKTTHKVTDFKWE